MRQHHTHTHENSSSLCTSVAPTHTTAASQAAGPLTVVAVGGRDDRAVTSVLKASSYGVHETPSSRRWSCWGEPRGKGGGKGYRAEPLIDINDRNPKISFVQSLKRLVAGCTSGVRFSVLGLILGPLINRGLKVTTSAGVQCYFNDPYMPSWRGDDAPPCDKTQLNPRCHKQTIASNRCPSEFSTSKGRRTWHHGN